MKIVRHTGRTARLALSIAGAAALAQHFHQMEPPAEVNRELGKTRSERRNAARALRSKRRK